jgi:catechol 2,3-dioxygenase-like lactoylglutathione lyase family enzyme
MGTHLEVVVIPVSDVDRAKAFYSMLGWRLDADVSGDEYRLVQFTPPGSASSTLDGHQHHEVEPGDSEARPGRGIESSHQLAVDVLGCQVFVG